MEQYNDPRWQRLRLEIMQRDGFRCVLCGDDKTTLHIHHDKYYSTPWETPREHLMTLCADCHKAIQKAWQIGRMARPDLIFNAKDLLKMILDAVNDKRNTEGWHMALHIFAAAYRWDKNQFKPLPQPSLAPASGQPRFEPGASAQPAFAKSQVAAGIVMDAPLANSQPSLDNRV